jgi:predicted TPR repeat methyltransferase
MQTKTQLEQWYKEKDPWDYFNNSEDKARRQKLREALDPYGSFNKALDVGAGEGFITRILPAEEIYFQELSDTASERHPKNHTRVYFGTDKKFDLVVATGVFYEQYDWEEMHDFAIKTLKKGGILLTAPTDRDWETSCLCQNILLCGF